MRRTMRRAMRRAKTVTIPRLLEICPAGTLDPTPLLYSDGLMICLSLNVISLALNSQLAPWRPKSEEQPRKSEEQA